MHRFELERHGELTPKEEKEARRYMASCNDLVNALLNIARENNVCPWCLLMHTGIGVVKAMEDGEIDHENAIMKHVEH